jgi:ketosteroid isomerase-like protein
MNNTIAMILCCLILTGCGSQKPGPAQIAEEKKAIGKIVTDFWEAHETKDPKSMNKFMSASPEFMFFGSDSAEVIRSLAEWETQKSFDVRLFESLKAGKLKNLSIQVSGDGEMASAMGEVPLDVQTGGEGSHTLDRFAIVFRKEGGEWHIVQGLITFTTTGQSSAELVARIGDEG